MVVDSSVEILGHLATNNRTPHTGLLATEKDIVMTDSSSAPQNALTPDTAKLLPDRELIASHDNAETIAEVEKNPDQVAEAARKAAVAENELQRRGTQTTD